MKKHKFVISKRVRTFTAEREREREREEQRKRERERGRERRDGKQTVEERGKENGVN